jgi:hypothetical protein
MRKIWIIILVLQIFLFLGNTSAHDINSNKITLIMREKTHISVILSINLIKAMNQTIAPETKYADFVLSLSNMDPKTFQKEYEKTKSKIASGIYITSKDQNRSFIRDWKWPSPIVLQNQFQVYVMELITGNHDHNKEPITEITGEFIDKTDKSKFQIQVSKEIQPVLLISYRPITNWSSENKAIAVEF